MSSFLLQGGPNSNQLLRITIVVIPTAICNSNVSYNGAVREGMLCAGNMNGGVGTCQVLFKDR